MYKHILQCPTLNYRRCWIFRPHRSRMCGEVQTMPKPEKGQTASPDAPTQQPALATTSEVSIDAVRTMDDLFARPTNQIKPVKAIHFKRTLTKELVAMAHREEIIFTCTSDMYTIELPAQGRNISYQPARVIDVMDEEEKREVMLICNEMMVSAFKRGGYAVVDMKSGAEDGKFAITKVEGTSLVGHSFGARAGDIKDDKNYRVVDVVEVSLERES